MQFKDIRANYSLFLFDKAKMEYSEVNVSSVGVPRFESRPGQIPQNVIDITVDVDGKPMTYPFPESLSKSYTGDMVVAVQKSDIVDEIRSMMTASERFISDVPKHEKCIERCKSLLADLDTDYKDKRQTEERFSKIESSISEMKDMIQSFVSEYRR